ncbi:MAG: Gfo/Idh/MocA family oxidoreductase [Rhodobacteraceae bacterium]|nr:Gfo/Idh/MocA family oxidoreductase [Paracoccaceae bacterium]
MAEQPIGVGILGTGRISDLHAIEYLSNPDSRLVALCDFDTKGAKAKATEWGVADLPVTDDFTELLARPDVDLVEILVPHHLHLSAALQAIAAGKAVSLQKPMCLNLAEADRLVTAAEASPQPFKLFENFLFFPPVVKATELIAEGAVGRPLSIRIKSNPGTGKTAWDVPRQAEKWRQQQAQSGGGPLVFDDGHHKFALAWHFMGMPEKLHAFIGACERPDGFVFDAQSIISLQFPDNRIGSFEIVYSPQMEISTRHYAQDDRVEITGTEGVIWINCGHGQIGEPPPVALYRGGAMREFRDVPTGWEQSFILSTRHYINVLKHGGTPVLTAAEGRQILRLALAAEQSAANGSAIDLASDPCPQSQALQP